MAKKTSRQKVQRSLSEATRATGNVTSELFRRFPVFFFVGLVILIYVAQAAIASGRWGVVFLCLLILVVSIGIYVKTRSYAETALAFILGLFTVFTISWDTGLMWIFVVFFLSFTAIIFMIGSVRLAAQKEAILTQAALFLDSVDYKATRSRLDSVVAENTPYQQIDIIERAEIVRTFAFRRVPLEHMKGLMKLTEAVGSLSAIPYPQAADFVCVLYQFFRPSSIDELTKLENFVNHVLRLPCSPVEFFAIFQKTRKYLVTRTVSPPDYLRFIRQTVERGLSVDDVLEAFQDHYGDSVVGGVA